MKLLVCSTENRGWMIHRCSECLSSDILKLKDHLFDIIGEYDDDTEITYKQWITTDWSTLAQMTTPVQEFVSVLFDNLEKLTSHSYIAKSLSSYLRQLNDNISANTTILLLDFAENFAFTIQDEIHSYHWNTSQATMHPVCVHHHVNDHLQMSFLLHYFWWYGSWCVIGSPDTKGMHWTCQKENTWLDKNSILFRWMCIVQPITKIEKNFINLCHHTTDFNVAVEWVFFATSHGKSPCDGIGGTIQQTATKAEILTLVQLIEFCRENKHGINFIFIFKETMEPIRIAMNQHHQIAEKDIPCRNFHHFIPLGDKKVWHQESLMPGSLRPCV